jgi:hypothetical protein
LRRIKTVRNLIPVTEYLGSEAIRKTGQFGSTNIQDACNMYSSQEITRLPCDWSPSALLKSSKEQNVWEALGEEGGSE